MRIEHIERTVILFYFFFWISSWHTHCNLKVFFIFIYLLLQSAFYDECVCCWNIWAEFFLCFLVFFSYIRCNCRTCNINKTWNDKDQLETEFISKISEPEFVENNNIHTRYNYNDVEKNWFSLFYIMENFCCCCCCHEIRIHHWWVNGRH